MNQIHELVSIVSGRDAAARALVLGALVLASGGAAYAQTCNITFSSEARYAAGNSPWGVALGDLDGDGDLDMVVANSDIVLGSNGDTSVLLNNGDGTFATKSRYAEGDSPMSVALGDLDGDGDLDIVAANIFGNDVSVLLNNGDGTFAPQPHIAVGEQPWSVALGDLDGDGDLDMAVTNTLDSDTSVLLGNGDGTFATESRYPSGTEPISVALGDLDGDGDLDMVTANEYSNYMSVRLNNGDGTFAAQQTGYATWYFRAPMSVALGDLDGDGDLDMAVASGTMSVLLNNGDGTFAKATSYGDTIFAVSVALGDLDGDGDLDMVTANEYSNNTSVLLGIGDGTFVATPSRYASGDSPEGVALGDLDGDGDLDMVTANAGSDDTSVFLNQCSQSCPADLNGDGTLNFFDISTFLVAFADQNPVADFTGDGIYNFFDVSAFLGSFSAGCP